MTMHHLIAWIVIGEMFDDEERREIYNEIQETVMEDVPVGFLVRQSYVNGTRADIEGYNPHLRIPELELEEISRS